MRKLRNKQGFTLIELVIVMAIIAILAALIIGAITVARRTARETANRTNAHTLQTALEAYYASHKNYPSIPTNTSFSAAATTTYFLGAAPSLDSTSCNGGTPVASGGGIITAGGQTYTITIANADCNTSPGINIGTLSYP